MNLVSRPVCAAAWREMKVSREGTRMSAAPQRLTLGIIALPAFLSAAAPLCLLFGLL